MEKRKGVFFYNGRRGMGIERNTEEDKEILEAKESNWKKKEWEREQEK